MSLCLLTQRFEAAFKPKPNKQSGNLTATGWGTSMSAFFKISTSVLFVSRTNHRREIRAHRIPSTLKKSMMWVYIEKIALQITTSWTFYTLGISTVPWVYHFLGNRDYMWLPRLLDFEEACGFVIIDYWPFPVTGRGINPRCNNDFCLARFVGGCSFLSDPSTVSFLVIAF